jgi:hypothetical protein
MPLVDYAVDFHAGAQVVLTLRKSISLNSQLADVFNAPLPYFQKILQVL